MYCMLVNEWAWSRSLSLLTKAGSGLRFSFGVKAWTEMEIWCVKGMHRLKLVSSGNNSVFKGLYTVHVLGALMYMHAFNTP